jgi:DNA-binding NtrC family response regulator/ligand-binding sensor domain-containing protein
LVSQLFTLAKEFTFNKFFLHIFLLNVFVYFLATFNGHTRNTAVGDHRQSWWQDLDFEEISIEDGLSQSIVYDIFQDHRGFLWFCTEDGLNKYDGYNFTVFKHQPNDSNSLSHSFVLSVYEDVTGIFWIGTFNGGLNRYDPMTGKFKHYRNNPANPHSISHNVVRVIYEDRSGNLWIGTDGGLNKFDRMREEFIQYCHDPSDPYSISHDVIRSIYEDRSGILWIGTDGGGLCRFDRKREIFTSYTKNVLDPHSIPHNSIRSIYQDRTGTLWIGTYGGGLSRFMENPTGSKPGFVHYSSGQGYLSDDRILDIYEDSSGILWIGTDGGGLNAYNKEVDQFLHYQHDRFDNKSLGNDQIKVIYEDLSGVLWFGTYGGGLNKLSNKKRFAHYKTNPYNLNSLSQNIVWSIYQDKDGILWIGTHGGLNKFNRQTNKWTHYRHDPNDLNSISNDVVRVIYEDRNGILWLGTHGGGLNSFNKKTEKFTTYIYQPSNPNSISHNEIRSIYEDQEGWLWIGTNGGGLNRFNQNNGNFSRYLSDPDNPISLSNNYVRVIYQDNEGIFWIGTQGGGLNRFDKRRGEFKHYRTNLSDSLSLSNDYIFTIFEDNEKNLWIGTWGGGLNKFNKKNETFKRYTTQDGLADNQIYGILEDEDKKLWISTNQGLSKFDPSTVTFRTYTTQDGLQSNEFNGGAFYKSVNGEMFFGGINGFNAFYPDEIVENQFSPPVVITSFYIFNKEVNFGQPVEEIREINLSYKDSYFHFEFAGLDFNAPMKNKYAYKMEGLDEKWIYTNASRRFASFTTLSPGTYVFKVKASNSDGIWSQDNISIKLTISSPYWKSWWFRSSIILALLSIVFFVYRRRMQQLDRKRIELEERVKERTTAAQALQAALEEVENLKNRLHAENVYLQDEIKLVHNFKNIITQNKALIQILHKIEQVAVTDATVLILGESGTGKELLARAVHNISERCNRPLVKVNCSALPANLIESELFGHEKGAFTGAFQRKIGRFELANEGTIFLDEIGELPFDLQAKLLRFLQEGEFERVGSSQTIKEDVRVIAATNRDLEKEVENGKFREDLFYRLNVFPIHIPPLRERKEDIPLLVNHLLKKYGQKIGKKIEKIPQHLIDKLTDYDWPGNVRELENVIERAIIISPPDKITLGGWLPKNGNTIHHSHFHTLEENERLYILKTLEKTRWRVSGENGAAKILGVNPKTLESRMKKLSIHRKDF